MEEKLDSLKLSSAKEFNNLIEYLEIEVESWLVRYVRKNDDIEYILHRISMDFKYIENAIFNINLRQ
jgi:hypothetical protein